MRTGPIATFARLVGGFRSCSSLIRSWPVVVSAGFLLAQNVTITFVQPLPGELGSADAKKRSDDGQLPHGDAGFHPCATDGAGTS